MENETTTPETVEETTAPEAAQEETPVTEPTPGEEQAEEGAPEGEVAA